MPEAKIEGTVCEDRISELPEDLLVKILGLVPTKDAVATMFLSKRWLSIWTMVRTLEYKDSSIEEKDDNDESKKSIWWFLDKSLQLHKAPVIDELCIKLGPGCPTDADVGKWVANAVGRLVISLYFKLLWSADPTSLPESLYSCKSLQNLDLFHKILVDFPSSSCLPSLLVLRLSYVVYKDEASLVRFLSSCPVLKILVVERNKEDNVTKFIVKVPSLCFLLYRNYISLPEDNDAVDTSRCLVMDTPALETFIITDYSRDSCSVENMPCLKDAYINVQSFHGSNKFTRSLSSVLSLELCFTNEVVIRCSTINFSQLIKLRIRPKESDWLEPLMRLLKNAPKLKNLTVDCEFSYKPEDLPLSWNQPSSVPGCLSAHLEIFEWNAYGDTIEEDEFLTYILANSKCLKTATISLRPTVDILEEQDLIIEDLKDIPRVSPVSQLFFKRIVEPIDSFV